MAQFRIQIEGLTERPEPFEFEVGARWWSERDAQSDSALSVDAPFRFHLSACRLSDDVVIEGELEGSFGLECSRCAKRYPHALREPYRLVLEPLSRTTAEDPEGERSLAESGVCLGEDLEVGQYRGAVIGLDDFFAEVIALAMPVQPLCNEDCPGLCAHCGAGRTEDPAKGCGCEDEKIESPFAVLAQLSRGDA